MRENKISFFYHPCFYTEVWSNLEMARDELNYALGKLHNLGVSFNSYKLKEVVQQYEKANAKSQLYQNREWAFYLFWENCTIIYYFLILLLTAAPNDF